MNALIESLKRLYQNGQVTKEKIDGLLKEKKINHDEYEYIVNN